MSDSVVKSWPPANADAVIAERLAGKTARQIADEHHATEDQVRQWLIAHEVRMPGNLGGSREQKRRARNDPGRDTLAAWIESGLTRKEMAARLEVADKTLAVYLRNHGLRTDGREPNQPSRQQVRDAMAASDTREGAADRLGISLSTMDKLCQLHGIKGKRAGHAWKGSKAGKAKPSPAFRRTMTNETRAGIAEAEAKQSGWSREVGTDSAALIASAIASGRVKICPPAFCAPTAREPIAAEDRLKLVEHRRRMEAR
jgi:DNA-binding CsgD family transcriptional regulator